MYNISCTHATIKACEYMNIQIVFHFTLSFPKMKNGEALYWRQESEETFVRVHNTHYGTCFVFTGASHWSVVCHLFVEA